MIEVALISLIAACVVLGVAVLFVKDDKVKQSSFSRFFTSATPEEKKAVYMDVIKKSTDKQKETDNAWPDGDAVSPDWEV